MDGQQISGRCFVEGLRQALESEQNLLTSLTKMGRGVGCSHVAAIFDRCRDDIGQQMGRLTAVLRSVGEDGPDSPLRATNPATDELGPIEGSPVLDAVLASAIQAVHRHSVLRYQGLKTSAIALGLEDAERLLGLTMEEKAVAVDRLAPFTELTARDFRRAQSSDDERSTTLILSNDNRQGLQEGTIRTVGFSRRSDTGNSCG